jgi:hypothetical protein
MAQQNTFNADAMVHYHDRPLFRTKALSYSSSTTNIFCLCDICMTILNVLNTLYIKAIFLPRKIYTI